MKTSTFTLLFCLNFHFVNSQSEINIGFSHTNNDIKKVVEDGKSNLYFFTQERGQGKTFVTVRKANSYGTVLDSISLIKEHKNVLFGDVIVFGDTILLGYSILNKSENSQRFLWLDEDLNIIQSKNVEVTGLHQIRSFFNTSKQGFHTVYNVVFDHKNYPVVVSYNKSNLKRTSAYQWLDAHNHFKDVFKLDTFSDGSKIGRNTLRVLELKKKGSLTKSIFDLKYAHNNFYYCGFEDNSGGGQFWYGIQNDSGELLEKVLLDSSLENGLDNFQSLVINDNATVSMIGTIYDKTDRFNSLYSPRIVNLSANGNVILDKKMTSDRAERVIKACSFEDRIFVFGYSFIFSKTWEREDYESFCWEIGVDGELLHSFSFENIPDNYAVTEIYPINEYRFILKATNKNNDLDLPDRIFEYSHQTKGKE